MLPSISLLGLLPRLSPGASLVAEDVDEQGAKGAFCFLVWALLLPFFALFLDTDRAFSLGIDTTPQRERVVEFDKLLREPLW